MAPSNGTHGHRGEKRRGEDGRQRGERRRDGTGQQRGGGRKRGDSERRRERVRDEDGQFAAEVDQDDVLDVFDAVDGPVVTTTDVADVLGITTESARGKLNDLVRDGDLRRRKTGRTVVYWQVRDRENDGPHS